MHCLPCSSFYGSASIFQDTCCLCDHFQFPCHLGSHVPASKVDLVCAILLFVPTMVWLLMLGISDMHKDLINLCDGTPGLYKHCNRVCSEADTEKNPLLYMGVEPVSAACWTWCPTKLHPHPVCFYLHHLSLDLHWPSSVIKTILFTCVNCVVIRSLISAVSHTFLFIIFTLKTTQKSSFGWAS